MQRSSDTRLIFTTRLLSTGRRCVHWHARCFCIRKECPPPRSLVTNPLGPPPFSIAGIDVGFVNAISPAKEAVIVTTPEITAIRDADRVAGLLESNGIMNVKLLVNRVRPDMIQKNDMMSVKDVQVSGAIMLQCAICMILVYCMLRNR